MTTTRGAIAVKLCRLSSRDRATQTVLASVLFMASLSSPVVAQPVQEATTSRAPAPAAGSASTPGKAGMKPESVGEAKTAVTDAPSAARTKLLADTHMLLVLSRELQAEMAKSTPNTFSLHMVKKSEEIEKLAAVVKAEMAKAQ